MMRLLTVQQPAAGAIATLGKVIENRTWGPMKGPKPYRGLLAIHAGLRDMPDDHPFLNFPTYRASIVRAKPADLDSLEHHGAIIAVANLVDVHHATRPDEFREGWCCAPWGEHSIWAVHWVLEDVRPLHTPMKFSGGLGLRTVPEEVEREVLART